MFQRQTVFFSATVVTALIGLSSVSAGTINRVNITNDADSGIDSSLTYTAAVNFQDSGTVDVNGVTFQPAPRNEAMGNRQANSPGFSILADTYPTPGDYTELEHAGGLLTGVTGDISNLLDSMMYVKGGLAQVTMTLDPATLVSGTTYDFRLYFRQWTPNDRSFDLSFTGDGEAAQGLSLNIDDSATSYVSYVFTWDGVTVPTAIATPTSGQNLHIYAASNHALVPEPASLAALLAMGGLALIRRR